MKEVIIPIMPEVMAQSCNQCTKNIKVVHFNFLINHNPKIFLPHKVGLQRVAYKWFETRHKHASSYDMVY